jgi:hypothetical protein
MLEYQAKETHKARDVQITCNHRIETESLGPHLCKGKHAFLFDNINQFAETFLRQYELEILP